MVTDKSIEVTVSELLKKYNISSAPIDIFDVIKKEGLRLLVEDMEVDHSGFLLVERGKATIGINKRHHINRQRFTAAHELGHYQLHAKEGDSFFVDKSYHRSSLSSKGTNRHEIEANRFAANLLMPKEFVVQDTYELELMDEDIYRLAERYRVSEEAMVLRLAKLQLIEYF